jgi:hypothetical protein
MSLLLFIHSLSIRRIRPCAATAPMSNIAIIFDFDQTLTSFHMTKLLHVKEFSDFLTDVFVTKSLLTSDEFMLKLFGGLERIAMLHKALNYCANESSDIDLFVLSFGHPEEIIAALEKLKWLDFFKVIIGNVADRVVMREVVSRAQYNPSNARPKSQTVQAEIKARGYKRIIFIDDDLTQVQSFQPSDNVMTIHVETGRGITQNHLITMFDYITKLRDQTNVVTPDAFFFPDKLPSKQEVVTTYGCLMCENEAQFCEESSERNFCSKDCQKSVYASQEAK